MACKNVHKNSYLNMSYREKYLLSKYKRQDEIENLRLKYWKESEARDNTNRDKIQKLIEWGRENTSLVRLTEAELDEELKKIKEIEYSQYLGFDTNKDINKDKDKNVKKPLTIMSFLFGRKICIFTNSIKLFIYNKLYDIRYGKEDEYGHREWEYV